ncbi:MAG: CPBP family intramembrane metalloprotease, partial [Clostridia bacterium]|nr:CPBP family intramembrane metalloprotease [Clostridia bacterium]
SSLLFAMLHFDLRMLPMYLFSGLMLALCAYVTRSLLASCAVHLAYNLLVFLGKEKLTAFFAITDDTALIGLILTVALLVSLILIFGECQRTYAVYSEQNAISSHAASGGAGSFFIALLSPASIICIIVFIAAIII